MTPGASAPRWIVANLDCESDFARAAGLVGQPLSRPALEAIAGAATLLRAFGRDGDRLWLPSPVDAASVPEVPGLPMPAFVSGPLGDTGVGGEVLAWGETAEVARRRPSLHLHSVGTGAQLRHLPWRLPAASPEAAAAVNDRRFCLAAAEDLGCRLPGARIVSSARQLETHLAAGGARASHGAWVLKAPFSAAGRHRHIHRQGVAEADRRRIERHFERHRELLFEPWMERTADFGVAAVVTPEGTLAVSHHRLLVDRQGRFNGIELGVGERGKKGTGLDESEHTTLTGVLEGVGAALARAGYSGPFGIDAWRYRGGNGREDFQPLGEINGRMTFGLVARALVERLSGPLGLETEDRVRLVFGRPEDSRGMPLYAAGRPGGRAIWLEIQSVEPCRTA